MIFDGLNWGLGQNTDYINVPDSISLSPTTITLVSLVKRDIGTYAHYLRKGNDYSIDNTS
jgi:hypothetical protein